MALYEKLDGPRIERRQPTVEAQGEDIRRLLVFAQLRFGK